MKNFHDILLSSENIYSNISVNDALMVNFDVRSLVVRRRRRNKESFGGILVLLQLTGHWTQVLSLYFCGFWSPGLPGRFYPLLRQILRGQRAGGVFASFKSFKSRSKVIYSEGSSWFALGKFSMRWHPSLLPQWWPWTQTWGHEI